MVARSPLNPTSRRSRVESRPSPGLFTISILTTIPGMGAVLWDINPGWRMTTTISSSSNSSFLIRQVPHGYFSAGWSRLPLKVGSKCCTSSNIHHRSSYIRLHRVANTQVVKNARDACLTCRVVRPQFRLCDRSF
jgi:hypothetical protein